MIRDCKKEEERMKEKNWGDREGELNLSLFRFLFLPGPLLTVGNYDKGGQRFSDLIDSVYVYGRSLTGIYVFFILEMCLYVQHKEEEKICVSVLHPKKKNGRI